MKLARVSLTTNGCLHILPDKQEVHTEGLESILTDLLNPLSIRDKTSSDGWPSLLCQVEILTALPRKAAPLHDRATNLLENTLT